MQWNLSIIESQGCLGCSWEKISFGLLEHNDNHGKLQFLYPWNRFGLIVDGVHTCPEAVKLAYRVSPKRLVCGRSDKKQVILIPWCGINRDIPGTRDRCNCWTRPQRGSPLQVWSTNSAGFLGGPSSKCFLSPRLCQLWWSRWSTWWG